MNQAFIVLTLLMCVMLVEAKGGQKKGWCSYKPKDCGKRAWVR